MNVHTIYISLILSALLLTGQAQATGTVGDHVNDLQGNLDNYTEEVHWIIDKVDGIVNTYQARGREAAGADGVVDIWEAVDFHSAIETNNVPIYASIWQGLFGVKTAIDNQEHIENVREQQAMLEQSLWQALGAVKMAANYQQKGLLATVESTGASTPVETMDEIKQLLDRVVAKFAEWLPDEATNIVHDTYLTRFEGVEGMLIEQDAALVEDLEKDFNVTLPLAIKDNLSVDEVRGVVLAMQAKLDHAKSLLVEAEKNRQDVF